MDPLSIPYTVLRVIMCPLCRYLCVMHVWMHKTKHSVTSPYRCIAENCVFKVLRTCHTVKCFHATCNAILHLISEDCLICEEYITKCDKDAYLPSLHLLIGAFSVRYLGLLDIINYPPAKIIVKCFHLWLFFELILPEKAPNCVACVERR